MTGRVAGIARASRSRLLRGLIGLRAATLEIGRGHLVVVAPHPDDEVFGCGGLIARQRDVGAEVTVVYLTDGGASHRSCCGAAPERIGALRRAAAARACAALGVDGAALRWLGLTDGGIPARGAPGFADAVEALAAQLAVLRPTLLLAPCPFDGWPDHAAASDIVDAAAVKLRDVCRLLLYPVWMWRNLPLSRWGRLSGRLAFRLDVDAQRKVTQRAIDAYRQDLVPGCGISSCGSLPEGLPDLPGRDREYFFGPGVSSTGIRRIVYRTAIRVLQTIWQVRGGRCLRAFGARLRLHPETSFPSYPRLRLPAGSARSAVVRHGDYVQIHAAARYLESFAGAPVVVDVGAHHGAYAVVLGKIAQAKGGRVIALEPNPGSFAILRQNVVKNGLEGTVVCVRAAVADAAGEGHLSQCGSQSQLGSFGSDSARVAVTTLAVVLREHAIVGVDLLIVDVEGAELPVLRGYPWDSVTVDRIFCELHPEEWHLFGYGPGEMQRFLEARGLRAFDMYLQELETLPERGYIGPVMLLRGRGADR